MEEVLFSDIKSGVASIKKKVALLNRFAPWIIHVHFMRGSTGSKVARETSNRKKHKAHWCKAVVVSFDKNIRPWRIKKTYRRTTKITIILILTENAHDNYKDKSSAGLIRADGLSSEKKLASAQGVAQRSSGPLTSWSEQKQRVTRCAERHCSWDLQIDVVSRTLFSSPVPSGISNFTPDLAVMVTLPCRLHQQ
jgi:hypothetical protein